MWARDLAEANRCYLAYDFNGNELERIPLTSLVDGEIGNLVPMSMCQAGGRNIYLLTNRQTLRSSIIAHDLKTGEKEVLIPDVEECLFSHPYCCGGDLFISDYFSRTVFRYDAKSGAFEEFFSLPKSEYGVLNSFCCDGDRFLLQTNERLTKADAGGNILYSIKWSDMVRYDEFKVIGSTLVETGEGTMLYAFDGLNRLIYRVLV